MKELFGWSMQGDNYGFALSNPNFEYWLLLHFEDGHSIKSGADCLERLKRHFPEYHKGIGFRKITFNMIENAVARAKKRDNPKCSDWPRASGQTTVYRLVEKLII